MNGHWSIEKDRVFLNLPHRLRRPGRKQRWSLPGICVIWGCTSTYETTNNSRFEVYRIDRMNGRGWFLSTLIIDWPGWSLKKE